MVLIKKTSLRPKLEHGINEKVCNTIIMLDK